jgi:hypothetical protein
MGRGGRAIMDRESPQATTRMLERARLTAAELTAPCTLARIGTAIRAELWFGTLEGAHVQSRLGARHLLDTKRGWSGPAILYLAMGLDDVRAEMVQSAPESTAALATGLQKARTEAAPIVAATRFTELADVLGPIVALAETPSLLDMCRQFGDCVAAVAAVAGAAGDELAADAARRAGARVEHWRRAAFDADAAAELVRSYNDLEPEHADWVTRPRMELVMALDLSSDSVAKGLIETRSVPAALKKRRWSDGSTK